MLRRLLSTTQRAALSSGRSASAIQYNASRSLCEEAAKENSLDRIGTTWRNQDSLPVLPIQPVADTCARYREYLRPLLTDEEFAEANEQITKFENTSLAADLQSQLLGLQEHEASWLEAFWDEMYLTIRDRLPINVNPFFALDGQWESTSKSNQPIAVLVKAMARFNKVLKTRLLVPDMEGNTPLCMYQYSKLFGGNRYPRKLCDVFSSNRYSQRVIVMRRGQLFTMTVENDKQQLLPTSVLLEQIDAICKMSDEMSPDEPPVGYFTCSDREEWAENYAALQAHSTRNEANLDAIAGALFVINVDEFEYEEMDVRAKALFHNRGENRWFDKLQLAISSDGYVGFNMEHTPIDGHTLVQLATDVHADLDGNAPYPNSILLASAKTYDIPPPEHLKFDLDGSLQERLQKAKSEFESYADQTDSIPLVHDVGKRFVKKCNTSPDAFVQMAIQLAYYKEYGRFDSTYESALTKQFLHGRTETIRTVSETSKDYCSRFSTEKLAESGILLMEACRKHAKTAKLAKNGYGVDRHLFGLNCLAKIEKEANPDFQIPAIFTSPHYAKYGSNLISTSNCGADGIGLFGFGPVHPDGVGVGYLIKDESTHLHVSTTNGQGVAFSQRLQEALNLQCRALRATNADVTHE